MSSVRYPNRTAAGTSKSRRGSFTVEFALCVPILFGFVFGMMELTRYLYVKNSVQMSAYEASRAGVVPGATNADVQARADELMLATGLNVYTVQITPAEINSLTEEVSVTITCNFADNSWLPPTYLIGRVISTTITLQHENMAYLQPGDTDLASIIGDNSAEPIDE